MSKRTNRLIQSIGQHTAAIAVASPGVIAHRMTRMALAGAQPSVRDRKEFSGMVDEKHEASLEAWSAIAQQSLLNANAAARSMIDLWTGQPMTLRSLQKKLLTDMQVSALALVDAGLAPVRRRAVSNAQRLSKTRLR